MVNKLILGTVQMGLDYGVNNNSGKISFSDCCEILLQANENGIEILDTAEVYGNAHQIIGNFHKLHPEIKFKIITKVPNNIDIDSIYSRVLEYLVDLDVDKIEVLMFHSFDSYIQNKNKLKELEILKNNGYINHIGVSVYTNEQIEALLLEDIITVVQLPFNLLDNYSLRGNLIDQLKSKGKIIYNRSVFLQGLFFKNLNDENSIVQMLRAELVQLHQLINQLNCSMEELALSYCFHQKNIDYVIIGVDSINHLNTNINAFSYKIDDNTIKKINSIKIKNIDLLNPSLW